METSSCGLTPQIKWIIDLSFRQSSIQINLGDWSSINWTCLIKASRAHIVWIGSESSFDATALLVHPKFALRALNGIYSNSTPTDSTRECTGVSKKIKTRTGYHEFCFLHVDSQSLAFHTILPSLWLSDALLQRVRNHSKVISIQFSAPKAHQCETQKFMSNNNSCKILYNITHGPGV